MTAEGSRTALTALIFAAVGLNAGAQILLRIGARHSVAAHDTPGSAEAWHVALDLALRPAILAGLACYGVSVVLWIWVLGRTEVTFAYPFLGLGFVLVMIAGWAFFGEALSIQKIAATVLIVVGVVLMAGSEAP